jgi:hypothetical protein
LHLRVRRFWQEREKYPEVLISGDRLRDVRSPAFLKVGIRNRQLGLCQVLINVCKAKRPTSWRPCLMSFIALS